MPAPVIPSKATVPPQSIDLNALGRHVLLELNDCEQRMLTEIDLLKKTLVDAATEAGARVVETVFHQFSPHGLSGVVVIAESHITIHTWPEYGYAAVDVFTCGQPELADTICATIAAKFKAKNSSVRAVDRGLNLPPQIAVLPSNGTHV